MKVAFALLLCIALLAFCLPVLAEDTPDWAEDGVLRIFGIGNSYTQDTYEHLFKVCKALGVENVEIGYVWIGGSTVAQHIDNIKKQANKYEYCFMDDGVWKKTGSTSIEKGLKDKPWDFVMIQEQSLKSAVPWLMGDVATLAKEVKKLAPKAKLAWNMTWAYPNDYNTSDYMKYFARDNEAMYEGLLTAVKENVEPVEEIEFIIPNGTAIQNARKTYLGDSAHYLFRDNLHLSLQNGRHIVAMNTAATLTGLDVSPMLDYFKDDYFAKCAVEAVQHAQENPWAVTESAYNSEMDREAAANNYEIQSGDYYGNDGGWMVNDRDEYNWLENKSYAAKKGVALEKGTEKGAAVAVTLPEKGKTELLYLMNQPQYLKADMATGLLKLQLRVDTTFLTGGKVSLLLASGQTFSLENNVKWEVASGTLAAGWNELLLPLKDAKPAGVFNAKEFKVMQVIVEGPAASQVMLAGITIVAP